MAVSIIFFLIIINLIVVVHEYGHYIVAKRNGIKATEFFVGFGPKLIKWTKDGTEFSVRPLLFGGACIFEGMDALEDEKGVYSEGAFPKASVWARFATTLAGPVFNIILAYIGAVILVSQSYVGIPKITSVIEDSAAYEAGLQSGDVITKINGHYVHFYEEVTFISLFSRGKTMSITYERDGVKNKTYLTPKYNEEEQRYYMGITTGEFITPNALESIKYGFYETDYMIWSTVQSLKLLFTGQLSKDALSGPVGMVKMVDDTYDEAKQYGTPTVLLSMLSLLVILSANIAVLNLLPIPGLDGGRLLFIIIEMIRRKPVSAEKEGYVTLAGMALLLVLVVFVFFNDITKFFR